MKMAEAVPKVTLNNGLALPILGLGTYARKAEPGQYKQAVEWAIELGYRHIDTASQYKNEEEVGLAIASKIKEGVVKREDLFVTTKLWNDCHAESDVVPALKESLAKLKLDYVDLYLVHWPISSNAKGDDLRIDYVETWRGMEQAHKLGLAKSIGVSNFNEEQLARLMEHATVKPAVNQIEVNPTFTQHKLVDFCKRLSIVAVAYTPLGLVSDARPEFADKATIKTDPQLAAIAHKHGKSLAQIALKYLVQRGIPVLPKSFSKARLEENLNIFDFELTEEDMAAVDRCNIDHRCVPGKSHEKYQYFPF